MFGFAYFQCILKVVQSAFSCFLNKISLEAYNKIKLIHGHPSEILSVTDKVNYTP